MLLNGGLMTSVPGLRAPPPSDPVAARANARREHRGLRAARGLWYDDDITLLTLWSCRHVWFGGGAVVVVVVVVAKSV